MYLQRFYLECLSHASFLIGDERTKEAVVIDPQRDVDIYVDEARVQGFKITTVILTHFHADFVAGHIELRDRVGAKIALGRRAEAEFDFLALGDGDEIRLGDVRLRVLETPGHTPEGISLVLYDEQRDANVPYAVFTGDTLFLGDVGRPDLLASIGVTADELANMLYESLHEKLLKLPDATLVYPAHGAGSMCGKSLSSESVSTLGEQRKYNYALQPMTRDQFVAMVTEEQPEAPDYFVHDAVLNRQDRKSLDAMMDQAMQPLTVDEILRLQSQAVQIVDTRDAREFAAAHMDGAINIGIDGKYATWAGTVLEKDKPIIVIADADRVEESVMRLGRIGFDHVKGYLRGGMDALRDHENLVRQVNRVSVQALDELEGQVSIIDVRSAKEWQSGHIEGSLNLPLNHLDDQLDQVPREGTVVVHCQGGYRSSLAVSILQRAGFENVVDLVGGFKAWTTSHRPTTEATA